MKKFLILLILVVGKLNAQTFKISGHVNIPLVTLTLYRSPDSIMIKAAIVDSTGNFNLQDIGTGKYYLICTGIGYQSYRSSIYLVNTDLDLPKIILLPETRKLDDVTIIGKKQLIEVLPDKTVLHVENSLLATGLSAFEVLRKAPGVIVDNQNNLILEGKTGVSIFIDGKRSLLSGDDLTNYLKTIQSSDIETLELMTQPSSKYDAAGNAGIINIRLIKNKSFGTNGSVLLGYGIGRYSKYNSAFTINNRIEKLNLFTSYSNSFNKSRNYLNLDRFQNEYEYDNRSYDLISDRNHNIKTGMDYNLNKTSTVGLLLNGVFKGYGNNDYSRTPIRLNTITQQVLIANGLTTLNSKNLSTNINYHYLHQKGAEITFDGDYGFFQTDRDQTQSNVYYTTDETIMQSQTNYEMITPVNIHFFTLKTDFTQPIGKTKLALGFKTSHVKTDNIFNFYSSGVYRQDRSNIFTYAENIHAAYFNLIQSWKNVSVIVGLRAEQTVSDGELSSLQQNQNNIVKRNYTDLFPSSGITYTLNAKDNVTLSYSRRVDRPDYRSLNPFENNIDELSFSKGNPFLRPQYTNTLKLSNTYNYTLTTSLAFSNINDFFAQITDTIGNNRNFISPQNIASQQVINLGVSYPVNFTKWWSIYASLNAFRSSYKSTNAKFVSLTKNTLSLYASNSFTLPRSYSAEVSGWYSSPSVWSGSYRTNSLGSIDIAIQKTFLKNRFSMKLAVSDVLYTSNWSGASQYGGLRITGSGGYDSRQFMVNVKYNFGRKEVKAPNNRSSGADDEKGRIKI